MNKDQELDVDMDGALLKEFDATTRKLRPTNDIFLRKDDDHPYCNVTIEI